MSNPTDGSEFELDKEWEKTRKSFVETFKKDLTEGPIDSPEDAIKQIGILIDKRGAAKAKHEGVKKVLCDVLGSIQLLGSVAAQGVGTVLVGTNECFNAVSYLITVGQNYRSIFSKLTELFVSISDILKRFTVYLQLNGKMPNMIDVALREIICRLLLSVVRICELSVKVFGSKRNRAKLFFKVFAFNDDGGVGSELKNLNQIVDNEQQMRGTLTYTSVMTNQRNINDGFAGTDERLTDVKGGIRDLNGGVKAVNENLGKLEKQCEGDTIARKHRRTIERALGDTNQNLQPVHQDLLYARIPKTGQWLLRDPLFTKWVNRERVFESVLCLAANERYGKSHLIPTIVHFLKEKYAQGPEGRSRTSIAYYYFSKAMNSTQSSERDLPSLAKALKTLAWQIAQNDPVYQKDLASYCENIEDAGEIHRLWERLFVDCSNRDATFFILLDDVDQIGEQYNETLLQIINSIQTEGKGKGLPRVRLLLSGRVNRLESLQRKLKAPVLTIDVASKNGEDIELYIKREMDRMKIFSELSLELTSLKDDVFTGLAKYAEGDFINVALLLNEIGTKQRLSEIRAVLAKAEAGKKRSDTIIREIERCNKSLGDADIQDLNELLIWVIPACRPMTLGELDAVLYMKNGEPPLWSLQGRVQDQYSSFLKLCVQPDTAIDLDASVVMVSDSIEDTFKKALYTRKNQASTSGYEINNIEVNVSRLLNELRDQNLVTKYDFEKYFGGKSARNSTEISFDPNTAPLEIVTGCLKVIGKTDDQKIKPLLEYAIHHFPNHLQQIDLPLVDLAKKCAIGKMLLRIFTDDMLIENWWTEGTLSMRHWWLYNDYFVETVLEWLQDSEVIEEFLDRDRDWIKSLAPYSKLDTDLLRPITRFMAVKWLQDRAWETNDSFLWVYGCINKLKSRNDPDHVNRLNKDPSSSEIEASDILDAAEWAARELGLDQLDYECLLSCGHTLREYEKLEDAIRIFEKALSMTSGHWDAEYGLALIYGDQKKWQLAIETLEPICNTLLDGGVKALDLKTGLCGILRDLAHWHKELGEYKRAMELYDLVLENSHDDAETTFNIIVLHDKQGTFSEMLQFLQNIRLHRDRTTDIDMLTRLYHDNALYEHFHWIIIMAAKHVGNLDFVKQTYQIAIEVAEEQQDLAISSQRKGSMAAVEGYLRYHCAIMLFQYHGDEDERTYAVDLWEHTMNLKTDSNSASYLQWAQFLSASKLSTIYVDRAKLAGPDSKIAVESIDKLVQISSGDCFQPVWSWFSLMDTRLLLGRYYRVLDQNDDRARNLCRSHVMIALDLLSDEDPTNDWQGYRRLADALMYFGDDDNALAAWSLLRPNVRGSDTHLYRSLNGHDEQEIKNYPSEGSQEGLLTIDREIDTKGGSPPIEVSTNVSGDPGAVPVTPASSLSRATSSTQEPENPAFNSCSGYCGVEWNFADDIYVCKDCFDVQFDSRCWDLLRNGPLGFNVCSKDHDFLHVPKYDAEEASIVGKKNVRVGTEIIPTRKWLKAIRLDWRSATEELDEEKNEEVQSDSDEW